MRLLMSLSQGLRTAFDSKTHRQIKQAFTRFSYVFLTASYLQDRPEEEVVEEVLEHLSEAEDALVQAWGEGELAKRGQTNGQDEAAAGELGRKVLNQVHRDLLLRAISEQWVEYLTRVEALRVSIGLEAYAQRDPLVQYKTQASQMFQGLMADIRSLVISRVFSYQPRRIKLTLNDTGEGIVPATTQTPGPAKPTKKKRKRKRHKKK
jgi:preprotein translocase subunit SecA